MRHDRAKSSCFEFIGVEKECYERWDEQSIKRRQKGKRVRERERETSGRKDGSRFTRITQHLSRELALTLYISLSFIENISKNDASDTYIYIYITKIIEIFHLVLFHHTFINIVLSYNILCEIVALLR